MNTELDLTLRRVIRAPRRTVWRAWTDPARLERWWLPAPAVARIDRLELQPGGAFVSRMSEDGAVFVPHVDGVFLAVDDAARIVFTNAIDSTWRPAAPAPVAMKPVLMMLQPLRRSKSATAPSTTQVRGAIWRGARR